MAAHFSVMVLSSLSNSSLANVVIFLFTMMVREDECEMTILVNLIMVAQVSFTGGPQYASIVLIKSTI